MRRADQGGGQVLLEEEPRVGQAGEHEAKDAQVEPKLPDWVSDHLR